MLTTIERERITSIIVAPPGIYALLDHPLLEQANLSSLLQVTCGGSVASPARLIEAIARLGPVVRLVYAMSEAPQVTELPDLDHDPAHPERLRSCGKPYGGMHIQVRDGSAAILPPGEPGDIWISGPLVMTGYWEDPELTHAALVAGWLRTGDYGYLDEAGFLYLLGRASDVIITGIASTNVYPGPIEDALVAHRGVRAAAVIGVPDESMGEAVVAFVVPSGEATATAAELIAAVTATLNKVWAPRDIEFVDSLPVIGFGKVDKKVLRDGYVARRTSA
jgi:acyl-CoA synthetase (AMP-forming)/AMP-acid ligase II